MADASDSDVPAPASDDLTPADDAAPQITHDQGMALAHAHGVAGGEHLAHMLGYLSDPTGYDPSEPRGMERFAALSAERRTGFPAGSGAARSMDAMRGRP